MAILNEHPGPQLRLEQSQIHRIRSGIGAMIATLGGIDALVFSAAIGKFSRGACRGMRVFWVSRVGSRCFEKYLCARRLGNLFQQLDAPHFGLKGTGRLDDREGMVETLPCSKRSPLIIDSTSKAQADLLPAK
jgi:hypothetical protein